MERTGRVPWFLDQVLEDGGDLEKFTHKITSDVQRYAIELCMLAAEMGRNEEGQDIQTSCYRLVQGES